MFDALRTTAGIIRFAARRCERLRGCVRPRQDSNLRPTAEKVAALRLNRTCPASATRCHAYPVSGCDSTAVVPVDLPGHQLDGGLSCSAQHDPGSYAAHLVPIRAQRQVATRSARPEKVAVSSKLLPHTPQVAARGLEGAAPPVANPSPAVTLHRAPTESRGALLLLTMGERLGELAERLRCKRQRWGWPAWSATSRWSDRVAPLLRPPPPGP